MTLRARHLVVSLAIAASLGLSACQGTSSGTSASCVSGIEYEGHSYTAYGVVHAQTSPVGVATPTACLEPIAGVPPVNVGSFAGYSPTKVLGGADAYGDTIVYVSDSVNVPDMKQFWASYPRSR